MTIFLFSYLPIDHYLLFLYQGIAKRVDWIKNLVLELIRSPVKEADGGDANFQLNFKSMIQTVLGHCPARFVFKFLVMVIYICMICRVHSGGREADSSVSG